MSGLTNGRLAEKTLVLCVTGSVAAYKAAILLRLLRKEGARVICVMSSAAEKFLGASTLSGLSGEDVVTDMFEASGEAHVDLGGIADAVVIAPATADVLARMAQGRADDLITALVLSAKGPVLAAPAMHPRMWTHPSTKRNVADLAKLGRVEIVGPAVGEVASGDKGAGRMVEPEDIVEAIVLALTPKDLEGLRIIVTAGPTLEDLDPVRFLGNRSTGKMGFAVAARAAARGADVLLIAGPAELPTPPRVERVDTRSALDMQAALADATKNTNAKPCDAIVMAAAVGDYRPAQRSPSKLKKGGENIALDLVRNPDLLASSARPAKVGAPVLVGFALETGTRAEVVAEARRKLRDKKVDVVVANEARFAFGGDSSEVSFITENRDERLPRAAKVDLADALLDRIKSLLG